ncbi:MAG: FeoB-associated Cys-rich membrane protein [Sulfurospirillaceae bacterium]|nr:FeoB-associated Cys-rich membrane protein [Sulfurospirillaceae bacterium]MCK9545844.1 FeoB-associated Cys-rich membrane protein [Sulfurospirillaceae bacterium]MDY0237903.1 FeoB-associated Cys-rich membrane protein [Campylobacterales bacterium]NLM98459.1 FeoB-associated Cys-rich membrane protein [Campylobacteraceae bacterium]
MESLFLIIIALLAVGFIYYKTFKNKGCNCGNNSCPVTKKKSS